jgi:carbamoyltransferase
MSDVTIRNILGIEANFLNPDREANESSVSFVKDGELRSCIAEERLSRIKLDGKFPYKSIREVLRLEQINIGDIDVIAVPFLHPKKGNAKYMKAAWTTFFDTGIFLGKKVLDFTYFTIYNALKSPKKHHFEYEGKKFELHYVEHHTAHAAGAYYCSPFDEALVLTLDGGGDGLDGTAFIGKGTKLIKLFEIPHFQSPGTMYSGITLDLGFKRHRHEGKITGLAAYGKPDLVKMGLDDLIKYDNKKHRFVSKKVAKHHRDLNQKSNYFGPLMNKFSNEDLAGAAQVLLERETLKFVQDAINVAKIKGYNPSKVCLAGGCFANVKLNQRILELNDVENIFVYPAMGDDGLSGGAALYCYYNQPGVRSKAKSVIKEIYKGGEFSNEEIEAVLIRRNIVYKKHNNVEVEIAKLLADRKVVGRFNGKMEYGPRSLGNRSIIAAPFDPSINDWLNKRLSRTEFMPFAPSIIEEAAAEYFENYQNDHIAADFMTVTYNVRKERAAEIPAVVHVDNTARPQVVRKSTNPSYHLIISEFAKITGVPVVLNTSYNIHEQPIIYTPDDAVDGFLEGKLDVLAIGNFICELK